MKIAIYTDLGVGPNAVKQWIHQCETYNICYTKIHASDILNESLPAYDILIMPGGADIPYCQKLHGKGVKHIQNFIANGGRYIGSCAGAYFAHSHIRWHNTTESIVGKRELSLFSGTATGPLVKPYVAETEQGGFGVPVHLKVNPFNIPPALMYVHGGPRMYVDSQTTVYAEFVFKQQTYPAIIYKKIGHGDAFAISPHMEYSETFLKQRLLDCPHRQDMWSYIFQHILLAPSPTQPPSK